MNINIDKQMAAAPEADPAAEVFASECGSKVILLIDDMQMVRNVLRLMLKSHGYRVLTAENGAQGIQRLRQYGDKIDLLITDIDMPVMNGFDVSRAAQQSWPALPVIMISGNLDRGNAEVGLDNVCGTLHKPFEMLDVISMVEHGLAIAA